MIKKWKSLPPINLISKLNLALKPLTKVGTYTFNQLSIGFGLSKNPGLAIAFSGASIANSILDSSNLDPFENWEKANSLLLYDLFPSIDLNISIKESYQLNAIEFCKLNESSWMARPQRNRSSIGSNPIVWCYPDYQTVLQELCKSLNRFQIDYREEKYKIEPIINSDYFFDSQAEKILSNIQKFQEKRKPRSILFVGPPGTGKSAIASLIGEKLSNDFCRLSSSVLNDSIVWDFLLKTPKLKTIIIDDIDHHGNNNQLISILEKLNKKFPLILMTCNSTSEIKGALLRPGRVDEIYEIHKPSPDLVEFLSPKIPQEYKDHLQDLSAAYIEEINNRCEVLGVDDINSWIEEMKQRILQVGDGWIQKNTRATSNDEASQNLVGIPKTS